MPSCCFYYYSSEEASARSSLRRFLLRLRPRLHGSHAAVDVLPQLIELGLVVRHDSHGAVGVEVTGYLRQGEAVLGDLLHGPLEQLVVVVLKWICPPIGSTCR